jgi:hypothetical protein
MLTFFASASDFTRRLTSVEANAKFARLDAGALSMCSHVHESQHRQQQCLVCTYALRMLCTAVYGGSVMYVSCVFSVVVLRWMFACLSSVQATANFAHPDAGVLHCSYA